ncbi:MAG: hypothetical protein APF78_03825 [Sphingomonadales bacterium BRH_c3]|nr:MAG: hypothetical protein APF78_03825 [Sphingomonadales bacterium BRH_c3]
MTNILLIPDSNARNLIGQVAVSRVAVTTSIFVPIWDQHGNNAILSIPALMANLILITFAAIRALTEF